MMPIMPVADAGPFTPRLIYHGRYTGNNHVIAPQLAATSSRTLIVAAGNNNGIAGNGTFTIDGAAPDTVVENGSRTQYLGMAYRKIPLTVPTLIVSHTFANYFHVWEFDNGASTKVGVSDVGANSTAFLLNRSVNITAHADAMAIIGVARSTINFSAPTDNQAWSQIGTGQIGGTIKHGSVNAAPASVAGSRLLAGGSYSSAAIGFEAQSYQNMSAGFGILLALR